MAKFFLLFLLSAFLIAAAVVPATSNHGNERRQIELPALPPSAGGTTKAWIEIMATMQFEQLEYVLSTWMIPSMQCDAAFLPSHVVNAVLECLTTKGIDKQPLMAFLRMPSVEPNAVFDEHYGMGDLKTTIACWNLNRQLSDGLLAPLIDIDLFGAQVVQFFPPGSIGFLLLTADYTNAHHPQSTLLPWQRMFNFALVKSGTLPVGTLGTSALLYLLSNPHMARQLRISESDFDAPLRIHDVLTTIRRWKSARLLPIASVLFSTLARKVATDLRERILTPFLSIGWFRLDPLIYGAFKIALHSQGVSVDDNSHRMVVAGSEMPRLEAALPGELIDANACQFVELYGNLSGLQFVAAQALVQQSSDLFSPRHLFSYDGSSAAAECELRLHGALARHPHTLCYKSRLFVVLAYEID